MTYRHPEDDEELCSCGHRKSFHVGVSVSADRSLPERMFCAPCGPMRCARDWRTPEEFRQDRINELRIFRSLATWDALSDPKPDYIARRIAALEALLTPEDAARAT